MKVVQLRRLLQKDKDGLFIKNDNYVVKRNRAVIDDNLVKEFEANYKETGLIYVVDEEATKEFNDSKKPKKKTRAVKPKTEPKPEIKE